VCVCYPYREGIAYFESIETNKTSYETLIRQLSVCQAECPGFW